MEAFNLYLWAGNIRELENLMERAYILEASPILTRKASRSEIFSSKDSSRFCLLTLYSHFPRQDDAC